MQQLDTTPAATSAAESEDNCQVEFLEKLLLVALDDRKQLRARVDEVEQALMDSQAQQRSRKSASISDRVMERMSNTIADLQMDLKHRDDVLDRVTELKLLYKNLATGVIEEMRHIHPNVQSIYEESAGALYDEHLTAEHIQIFVSTFRTIKEDTQAQGNDSGKPDSRLRWILPFWKTRE